VTTLASPGATVSMDTIGRYYTISQTGGTGFSYGLRLHYEDNEIGSPNSESTLKLWRRASTSPDTWTRYGATSGSSIDNWVESTGITTMGTWSLSSRMVANMTLALLQNGSSPAAGDIVTYTINYQNAGDGSAANTVVNASAPANTTYVPNSVKINDVTKTDADDGDEVTVSGSSITVNLSTVSASASGTITYSVRIN
jgi:uncharacterized repeat protein (TIGR01451 family)